MRASFFPWLGAFVLAGLSACGGGGSGGSADPGTPRAFTRSDSSVTVVPNGTGGYTASQAITISNDDAGASQAVVNLINVAGSVSSSPSSSGYQIQVTLTASGDSEQAARQVLATMTVAHRDAVAPGTLYLDNEVRFADYPGDEPRTAAVAASLPASLDYRLREQIAAGAVSSSGLQGAGVWLDAASGAATLSGTWDVAAVNSVSGAVTVSGDIARLQASSTSAAVQVALTCVRDTQADLNAVSGGIDVTVAQNVDSGFDLRADTTSGTATIVVAGTSPVGAQSTTHAHYRSPDYATSDPQISIAAHTTSGSILIHE